MIDIADFHKTYRDTVAVCGLSFRVGPGEILGLVGPNGAGKTTTLRAVAGIIPPTQGRLIVAGHDVADDPVAAKLQMAYVPDDPKLFESLTVWEHLEFVAAAYRLGDFAAKAEDLLGQFELVEKRNAPAQELSRGMRQKVAIACAYLHDPQAILFDEPLTGLDPAGIRTAKESIISRAGGGAAVVISSHLLALVEDVCTHLLILHRGKRLFFGPVDEARTAFADPGARASLEEVFFRNRTYNRIAGRLNMDRALIKLLKLRFRGALRNRLRGLKTVRGAVFFLLGLGVMLLWLGPQIMVFFVAHRTPMDAQVLHDVLPLVLLGLLLMSMLGSARMEGIHFTAAEVDFLFSGPFSRRQLLLYKLTSGVLAAFFTAMFFSIMMLRFAHLLTAVFLGFFLTMVFVHLLTTALVLAGQSLSERMYTRAQKRLCLSSSELWSYLPRD